MSFWPLMSYFWGHSLSFKGPHFLISLIGLTVAMSPQNFALCYFWGPASIFTGHWPEGPPYLNPCVYLTWLKNFWCFAVFTNLPSQIYSSCKINDFRSTSERWKYFPCSLLTWSSSNLAHKSEIILLLVVGRDWYGHLDKMSLVKLTNLLLHLWPWNYH